MPAVGSYFFKMTANLQMPPNTSVTFAIKNVNTGSYSFYNNAVATNSESTNTSYINICGQFRATTGTNIANYKIVGFVVNSGPNSINLDGTNNFPSFEAFGLTLDVFQIIS
jgi:hypothetical protein